MGAPGTTSGPWAVSKRGRRKVTSHHGVVICNAVLRNMGGPKHKTCLKSEHEAETNAHQIAASPALYDALVKAGGVLRDYITAAGEIDDDDQSLLVEIDAALRLARGEGA